MRMRFPIVATVAFAALLSVPTLAAAVPATNPDVTVWVRDADEGAVATFATPTDTDPGAVVTCSPASGSTFAFGETTVTCNGTKMVSQPPMCTPMPPGPDYCISMPPILTPTGTSTFKVTVAKDDQPPTFAPTSRIEVPATAGTDGAVVTYTLPTVTDNAPDVGTVTCVPASGFRFPVGTSQVGCFAVDRFGNAATSTFEVVVRAAPVQADPDTTPPTALVSPTFSGSLRLAQLARPLTLRAMCSERCAMRVVLTVPAKVVKRRGKAVVLGSRTTTLAAGAIGTVKFTVPRANRTLLRTKPTSRTVRAALRVTVRDDAGNERTAYSGSVRVARS